MARGLLALLPFVGGLGLLGSPFLHHWLPRFPPAPVIEPVHPGPDRGPAVGMGVAIVATAPSGRIGGMRRNHHGPAAEPRG